jgi:hypothetical protein
MALTLHRRRQAPVADRTDPGPLVVEVRSPAAVWWRTYVHHLRLLRNGAIAWIAGLAGIGWGVAATFEMRHGSPEELAALRDMVGIPAFEALMGRYVRPDTVEGSCSPAGDGSPSWPWSGACWRPGSSSGAQRRPATSNPCAPASSARAAC